MLKLQADYVFPIHQPPIENGVVVVSSEGYIVEVVSDGVFPHDEVTRYQGVLCPGFVNAHCHIELSHLKGVIAEGTGLIGFLQPIGALRQADDEATIFQKIADAEKEMMENGIVAVGDISNTTHSFVQKNKGNMKYHTFLEIFGLNPVRAETSMELGKSLFESFPDVMGNRRSIAPHAPYSVSGRLLRQIEAFSSQQGGGVLSIHNQECWAEEELYRYGTGDFIDFYRQIGLGNITDFFTPPGTSSLQYILAHLSGLCKLLLIHNTFTTAEDIAFAQQTYPNEVYWCFCPNANLYIENRLPDFDAFIRHNCRIVIGTDSLTSNWQLCVLSELKTIAKQAPHIPIADLLRWATLNGAQALGFEKELGSFETGKKPGVVLIENLNPDALQLTEQSTARKIVVNG
jgi:cytosine/adenosine deaminase-related metal-dependent hydrolase